MTIYLQVVLVLQVVDICVAGQGSLTAKVRWVPHTRLWMQNPSRNSLSLPSCHRALFWRPSSCGKAILVPFRSSEKKLDTCARGGGPVTEAGGNIKPGQERGRLGTVRDGEFRICLLGDWNKSQASARENKQTKLRTKTHCENETDMEQLEESEEEAVRIVFCG